MEDYRKIGFEPDEIEEVLRKVRLAIKRGHFYVCLSGEGRAKNRDFAEKYKLNEKEIGKIVAGLKYDEFVHARESTNETFKGDLLYVFVRELYFNDSETERNFHEKVYIKLSLKEKGDGEHVVVISFHSANKHYEYLFRTN